MSAPQKYRTTFVVDAVQWTGSNLAEIDGFIDDGEDTTPTDGPIFLDTDAGEQVVHVGDWITRDGDGILAAVAGSVFASTYEAVQA